MTVIVWDWNVLAVDSRRSHEGEVTSDNAWKLGIVYSKGRVRSKKVLVVVSCGKVETTDKIKRVLRSGGDIEAHFLQAYKGGQLDDIKPGTVLIITAKNAFKFRLCSDKPPQLTVLKKGELVTMGSGGRYARFMIKVYGLSPQYAIAATMLYKKCCGGPVRYWKRPVSLGEQAIGSGKTASIKFTDEAHLKRLVMDATRKKCHRARDEE